MRWLNLPGNLRAGLLWAAASFAVLTLLGARLTGLENALTDLRFRSAGPLAEEIALVLDDSG